MRRRVLEQIQKSFPNKSAEECHSIARGCYLHFGKNLAEAVHLPRLDRAWMEKHIRFEGEAVLQEIDRKKRGMLALTFHFGHWELAGAFYPKYGRKVAVVAFAQTNRRVDALIRKNREQAGMEVIYTGHAGTARILRVLREGGIVGLLADQNAGAAGLKLNFLGRPASVSRAPAVLAYRTEAPLVAHFLWREENACFRFRVFPPLWADRTRKQEEEVERLTRAWLAVQEEMVLAYPEHFFWFHRRWKHYEN